MVDLSLNGKFSDLKIYKNTSLFDNWIMKEHPYWDAHYNGEYNIALKLIKDNDTFFDVGANFGTYPITLNRSIKNLSIYCFEPVPVVFLFLEKNLQELVIDEHLVLLDHWGNFIKNLGLPLINQINSIVFPEMQLRNDNENNFFLINQALSDSEGYAMFNFDVNRPSVGGLEALPHSSEIRIKMSTVDIFCKKNNISHINFLKIDTEGHDYHVLKGTEQMLSNHKIDFIQFEYIARCKKAGWNLEKVYSFLTHLNYTLFKIIPDCLVLIDTWRPTLENYIYANFLAVSSERCKT